MDSSPFFDFQDEHSVAHWLHRLLQWSINSPRCSLMDPNANSMPVIMHIVGTILDIDYDLNSTGSRGKGHPLWASMGKFLIFAHPDDWGVHKWNKYKQRIYELESKLPIDKNKDRQSVIASDMYLRVWHGLYNLRVRCICNIIYCANIKMLIWL